MDECTYIQDRLDRQQAYHSKKASKYKAGYIVTNVISIVMVAIIPICSFTLEGILLSAVVATLAACQLICISVARLCRWHELWIEYRRISESLKREKYLYLTRVPPYDQENPFTHLVERVEGILIGINGVWDGIVGQTFEPPLNKGA